MAGELLCRSGLSDEDARIVADCLDEAELRGRPTHGLVRIPGLMQILRETEARKTAEGHADLRLAVDEGHYALLDGGNNLGYLAAVRGMSVAIERAQAHGTATVGVFNTNHSGMLGYYALMAAQEDLISLVVCNCSPLMTAYGSVEKIFGTNPIAIAIPSADGPILLDMSTAAFTYGDLIVALTQGRPLPEGVAIDENGNPTTDPEAAQRGGLLPFGGHKGHGLAFVIQLLAGPLVRSSTIPEPGQNYGLLMLVINPSIFRPLKEFKDEAHHLITALKALTPVPGFDEILYPGERGERDRRRRLSEGIEVDTALWQELKKRLR